MEVESQQQHNNTNKDEAKKILKKALLIVNYAMLVIGAAGGPLVLRFYFLKGGNRKWFSSWLQTAGCPIILIPLAVSYSSRRIRDPQAKPYLITAPLLTACAVIGAITGLDDFFYAYGISYLPVSTSSLLISTQLGFTAFFAFFLVRQRFTAYSINAVVLLMLGAVVLGVVDTKGDRPEGESRLQYYLGFFMTLGAAALYGVILPLVELTYEKAKQKVTYTLVLEMQLVMSSFATAFCTVGMLVNKDFQAIPREAEEFEPGKAAYYSVVVASAIMYQFFFVGTIGAIFYASALLAGVVMAVLIPVTEVLAVIFFNESFDGGKGIALVLSLWGFASYFYGEWKQKKKRKKSLIADPTVLATARFTTNLCTKGDMFYASFIQLQQKRNSIPPRTISYKMCRRKGPDKYSTVPLHFTRISYFLSSFEGFLTRSRWKLLSKMAKNPFVPRTNRFPWPGRDRRRELLDLYRE